MAKMAFLAVLLAALLISSGCLQPNADEARAAARNLPEIKEVLREHPSAFVSALYLSQEAVLIASKDIKKDCGNDIKMQPYWYITVLADGKKTELYLEENLIEVACVIRPKHKPEPLDHKCKNFLECDDNLAMTKDECKGSPRECVNTIITECKSGDDYCPPGCAYNVDKDCEIIDLCVSDADCSDSNRLTKDTCEGTPKNCEHELKTCEELGEDLCEEFEVCLGRSLPTKGKGVCCDEECVKTKSCEGVECPENYKCVNGNCYEMTCAERELELCASNEICDDEYFVDSLGIRCCVGECKQPCANDAECGIDMVCDDDGYCVFTSCSDAGGEICDDTEVCVGETLKAADSDECCTECKLKSCEERQGEICDISEFEYCSEETVTAFDTPDCCLDGCDINRCLESPCTINEKCDYDICVPLNCEERQGVNCPSRICDGNLAVTPDSPYCCIGECLG